MMKRFTLLAILAILAGNAWADVEEVELVFDLQVIEYAAGQNPEEDGTDLGDNGKIIYKYRQPALWRYFTGTDAEHLTFNHQETADDNSFVWTVTTTGDIKIATNYYATTDIARENCILNDGWVYFTGTSGSLRVTATQKDGSYSCSYTISYHQFSKKWNFYGSPLAVGTSSSGPLKVDLDSQSPHWTLYQTGTTGEEVYYYNGPIDDNGNPIDISGTTFFGYDCFPETAGLLFKAPMNSTNSHGTFGFYNESTELGAAENRFIALGVGAEVVIPASYYNSLTHPRIRIKMGRYGASTHCTSGGIELEITNGNDANGTEITSDYGIGGSMWRGPWGDYHQRGEYHFQPHNPSQDFKIKVKDGQYLKLYTIEVYESAELLTENAVLGDNYMLLNRDDNLGSHAANNDNGVTGTYYLHYYGKGERAEVVTNINEHPNYDLMPTGKITCNSSSFTENSNRTRFTYTSKYGEYGTFQIRLDCKTLYGNYVTDKATRAQSVGYLKPKVYPYTWDFTDVEDYEWGNNGRMGGDAADNESSRGEAHYVNIPNHYNYRYHWEYVEGNLYSTPQNATMGLRISPDFNGHNVCFCAGSQLWYGTTMIPELEGIGFTPKGKTSNLNKTLQILRKGNSESSPGIQIKNDDYSDYTFYLTVPSVPSTGAVYARVHPITNAAQYVRYSYGDGTKTTYSPLVTANASAVQIPTSDGTDDVIYVVKGDGSNSDVNLYFNGVIIQKIAVSAELKKFNKKGWTTESRNRDIDPSLTAKLNGRSIKTYIVTNVDYPNKNVTLTEIESDKLMKTATNDSKYACILRNTADDHLKIVNDGFYLFVPDMHDKQGTTITEGMTSSDWNQKGYSSTVESNYLRAQLTSGTVAEQSGDYTNFAFTYSYYDYDPATGQTSGDIKEGNQAFCRIAYGGAASSGNQAYLPLLTAQAFGTGGSGARFSIVFDDEDDNQPTTIEDLFIPEDSDLNGNANTRYYNLNGQKLNGRPAHSGLYIVNGKKMYIK